VGLQEKGAKKGFALSSPMRVLFMQSKVHFSLLNGTKQDL